MTLFKNLTDTGLEQAQDRLGGYNPLESDIYTMTVKAMYAGTSKNGATSVTLLADNNGTEYRETIYVTNRKGENFFLNKQDKTKKVPLPGFTTVDHICLITTGQPLSAQATEDKVLEIYDSEQKKAVPTTVPVLVDTIGKQVSLGIIKQIVDKNEKVGDEYVPTGETRIENVIDKVFHPEQKLTVPEALDGKTEAGFWDKWLSHNKDQTRDKSTKGAGGKTGAPPKPGMPPAQGSTTPRQSLFGNKG